MDHHSNWQKTFDQNKSPYASPHLGFLSPLLATMSFPRKEPPAGEAVVRYDGHKTMVINPGYHMANGNADPLPAPHGIFPRLIVNYIINTVREHYLHGQPEEECRVINFGRTRYEFLKRIGYTDNAQSYRSLAVQIERLLAAQFLISHPIEGQHDIPYDVARRQFNFSVSSTNDLWIPKRLQEESLWDATITISPTFYESIIDSASPIYLDAIKAWSHANPNPVTNCWIMDIGTWLTYRMSNVKKQTHISVDQLRGQFGPGQRDDWRYMKMFLTALEYIYPFWPTLEGNISVTKLGITLFPGPTMVPKKAFRTQITTP